MSYVPGASIAHALDPRTKLGVQIAFGVAAFAHTTPRGLAVLTVVTAGILVAARTPVLTSLRAFRFPLVLLLAAPILEGVTLGPPWFSVQEAWPPVVAGYRVVLLFLVSAAYVRTTPVRETQAAIDRLVPGRAGRLLGVGTGLVLRTLPLLVSDLRRGREAATARLGDRRRIDRRIGLIGIVGLRRTFARADRLAVALRARCVAWNPTPPALKFGRLDVWGGLLAGGLLVGAAL